MPVRPKPGGLHLSFGNLRDYISRFACWFLLTGRAYASHGSFRNPPHENNPIRFTLSTHLSKTRFSPDDWVSQAMAARMRKVSKQAIAKLVRKGRLRALTVGGHLLLSRHDVENFRPKPAGRPRGGSRA